MWQVLRSELRPKGIEVVTVALDSGGAADAGPWIDAAGAEHPSLIDSGHVLDQLLGITNVPMGVWIDEEDTLVRPPEVAHPGKSMLREIIAEHGIPEDAPQFVLDMLAETSKIRVKPELYANALRDWAENGADSRYVLEPDEVIARSRPRSQEQSEAAAHFELGAHLREAGDVEGSRAHFREAHRLDPENWTYKRQAWVFEDPLQAPSEHYESDWLSEIRARGAETYYALPDL